MKKLSYLFILSFIFLISSCDKISDDFQIPVRDYFDSYTNTAEVAKIKFKQNYPVDSQGLVNVPSCEPLTVEFFLINPKNFLLDFERSAYTDESVETVFNNIEQDEESASPLVFKQTKEDRSMFTATFSEEFLNGTECGGDITTSITFYQIAELSDGSTQKIPVVLSTYTLPLISNSAPQSVKNLTVMKDTLSNEYVLAFNMPDMTGIHRDIVKIKINNQEYDVEPVLSTEATGIDCSENTEFSTSYGSELESGNVTFIGYEEPRVIYYKTGVALSTEEIPFTVLLKDQRGLETESVVSEKSEQLKNVTSNVGEETVNAQDDGYSYLTFNAPVQTKDGTSLTGATTVYYEIYRPNGLLYKQGSGNNSVTVGVGTGNWYYKIWAHKPGFVDSETLTRNFTVKGVVYVDPSFTGSDSDGSRLLPFTGIEQAFAKAQESGFGEIAVNLLGNITLANELTLPELDITLLSDSAYKISGTITVNSGTKFILSKKLLLDKLNIGQNACIYLNDIDSAESVIAAVEYTGTIAQNTAVIDTEDEEGITESLANRMNLVNPGYYIGVSEGKGVIKANAVTVSLDVIDEQNINAKPLLPQNISYRLTAAKDSVTTAPVTQPLEGTQNDFQLMLTPGEWNVTAEVLDSTGNVILKKVQAVNVADNNKYSAQIKAEYLPSGNGSISLAMSAEPVVTKIKFTVNNTEHTVNAVNGTMAISLSEVPCGKHDVTFMYYGTAGTNDILLCALPYTIDVRPNLVTNTWIYKENVSDCINEQKSFVITKQNIIDIVNHEYFVKNTGSNQQEGNSLKPLATVNEAVERIMYLGDSAENAYTINVLSNTTLSSGDASEEIDLAEINVILSAESSYKITGTVNVSPQTKITVTKSLVLDTVHLSDGALLNLKNITSGTGIIANVEHEAPFHNKPVLKLCDSSEMSEELAERFILTNPGFYIGEYTGTGDDQHKIAAIRTNAVVAEVHAAQGSYTIELEGIGQNNTVVRGSTVSVKSIKDSTGKEYAVEKIILSKQSSQIFASNAGSININDSYDTGSYLLTVRFSDCGISVTGSILITVTAE